MASAPHRRALTWQPVPLTPRLGQSLQNLSPPGLQTLDVGTARMGLYVPAFLGHGFLQRSALGACDWWSLGHVPRLSQQSMLVNWGSSIGSIIVWESHPTWEGGLKTGQPIRIQMSTKTRNAWGKTHHLRGLLCARPCARRFTSVGVNPCLQG